MGCISFRLDFRWLLFLLRKKVTRKLLRSKIKSQTQKQIIMPPKKSNTNRHQNKNSNYTLNCSEFKSSDKMLKPPTNKCPT
jgi:hypothetical protein